MGLNAEKIREDFPALSSNKRGRTITYFDNACTSLSPKKVIEAQSQYYESFPSCAGRSQHRLGRRVTEAVESARKNISKRFNAKNPDSVIFTKNTSEALNLLYNAIPLGKGDVILTTDKEHNSNLIPAQLISKRKGAEHRIVYSKIDNGFDLDAFQEAMDRSVKLVSMAHTSNIDGCTIPAREISKIAHDFGALFALDGAQSAPHSEINIRRLGADFFACSGHKMLGPSGTGFLYGRYDLLETMQPLIVGGNTVIDSTHKTHRLEGPPARFEAGIQNYAGILGFSEAVTYLSSIGLSKVEKHEAYLNGLITEGLLSEKKISVIGPRDACYRAGIFSFNINGFDSHKIARLLDERDDILIRSGTHCAHSWFNHHSMAGCARASLYLYNTKEEAANFIDAIKKILSS